MKNIFKHLTIITLLFLSSNIFAQKINFQKNSHFYIGFDIRLATLATGTSIKTIMGVTGGYNQKISNQIFSGPKVTAMFIRSPINKGARISLFAGPSAEMEVKRIIQDNINNTSSISNRISWVFPINPRSNDYTYMDCISIGTSFNNDEILGFNQTSINLNIDFQRYDIGFYSGFNRMINVNTGSRTNL